MSFVTTLLILHLFYYQITMYSKIINMQSSSVTNQCSFDELEIAEMPPEMQDKINNQVLNKDTSEYNHNYGNCILCCTHKRKFNKNVYITGII